MFDLSQKPPFWILLVALVVLSTPAIAQISYVEVDARGVGETPSVALNEALLASIAQVNGQTLASESRLQLRERSRVTGSGSDYLADSDFQQEVRSATNGTISSYEIVSERETDGLFYFTVRAKVARYERSASAQRMRMAILPFRATGGNYSVAGSKIEGAELADRLTQDLVTLLVQSREFTVLDRQYVQEIVGERELVSSDQVRPEELARLGEVLVADLLLVGTLRSLVGGYQTVEMNLSDLSAKVPYVRASLGLRVIDPATQQTKFADTVTIDRRPATPSDSDGSSVRLTELATRNLAETASAQILEAIFPVLVVSVDGSRVTLNQGGKTMRPGKLFSVYLRGNVIRDPYTGEVLGREETRIGRISIETINPKFSIARIIDESQSFSKSFSPGLLVCRPVDSSKAVRPKDTINSIEGSIEELQSKPEEEELW